MRRDVAHDPMRARPSARLSEGASFGSVSLPDGVRVDLKPGGERASGDLIDLLLREDEQPRLRGLIRIRLQERRAARAERAIGDELDRPNRQMMLAEPDLRPALQVLAEERLVSSTDHDIEAKPQRPFPKQLLVQLDRFATRPRIMKARDPRAQTLFDGQQQRPLILLPVAGRDQAGHQIHRAVNEHTRRTSLGIADEATARRIRRLLRDPRQLQRAPIHPRGVPVHARQIHGMLRRDPIENLMRGKVLPWPFILIPSSTEDPFSGLRLPHLSRDPFGHLLGAPCPPQIENQPALPEPE